MTDEMRHLPCVQAVNSNRSAAEELAPVFALYNPDLLRNRVSQFLTMAYDAHQLVGICQREQRLQGAFDRAPVQGSEAFIHEERISAKL